MKTDKLIVKICGVKDMRSLETVVSYKPDMVGCIFVPNVLRSVSLQELPQMRIRLKQLNIPIVGVFTNQSLSDVQSLAQQFSLDYIQLHGEESPQFCRQLKADRIIKTIRLGSSVKETSAVIHQYTNLVDFFLIDRPKQGLGEGVDLQQVKDLSTRYPVILAGGITPENVVGIVTGVGVHLMGVDVSSGVERVAGQKDKQLVEDFISNARRAYEQFS